jgi:tetratricopeptide (TPR) repeat protein
MRRYLTSAVALAPAGFGWIRVEVLGRERDAGGLRKIIDQTDLSEETRNRALGLLTRLETLDTDFLESKYRELIAANPVSTAALVDGMWALEGRHELQKVEGLFTCWFDLRKGTRDLVWASVTAMQSAFLRRNGRVNEAWSVIEPAIDTWKADCLSEAAEVLAAMGRLDDAREMAERVRYRYPGAADVSAQVSEMLWRQKKFGEAADVLQNSRAQIRPFEWETSIARRFVWGLAQANDVEIESAYSELSRRGFDPLRVGEVATAIGKKGRHELAAKLLSTMPVEPLYRLMLDLMIYDELVRAGGARKAAEWFRNRASFSDPSFVETAFRDGHFGLLWDLSSGSNPNMLALLRAASLIMARKEKGVRWRELRAYFQKASSSDPLVVYGRYLTGAVGREAVLALWANPANGCSIAWILGLDAVRHDRYEEASDWFQVAVEAGGGEVYSFPEGYALKILQDWSQGERFLTELAPGTPLGGDRTGSPAR